jgi:hypothetical protein
MNLFMMQSPVFSCFFVLRRPKCLPRHPIVKHVCSSLNAKDQASHPYKRTGKILVNRTYSSLYFCIANWNTNYFARHDSKFSIILFSLLLIASYMQF